MLYYLMENQFIHLPNILHLPVCVTFLEKIKIPKRPCVLKFCSECSRVFVIYAEMNDKDDENLPLIIFNH